MNIVFKDSMQRTRRINPGTDEPAVLDSLCEMLFKPYYVIKTAERQGKLTDAMLRTIQEAEELMLDALEDEMPYIRTQDNFNRRKYIERQKRREQSL